MTPTLILSALHFLSSLKRTTVRLGGQATCGVGLLLALSHPVLAQVGSKNSDVEPGKSSEAKPLVSFIGFRVHEDRSSTFRVDVSLAPELKRAKKDKQIVFLIKRAAIERRNNKNPLNAQFFNSNVLNAKLDAVKEGVTLTINLRSDTSTQHRVRAHQAGATLIIDVPPPLKNPENKGSDSKPTP